MNVKNKDGLIAKPWNRVKFDYPGIPTMISHEERRYLYWLGASVWTGAGHVFEMGPWLGGSTICLAAGMRENVASVEQASKKLHVFDNFVWRQFMGKRAPLNLRDGESFLKYFTENTAAYRNLICTYEQSLPDDEVASDKEAMAIRDLQSSEFRRLTWSVKEPIEILFIDGAKSYAGLVYLLNEVRDHLIPGKTLLVCQDYKSWQAYWVPIVCEMLGKHLELVHNLEFNTVAFKVTSAIDAPLSKYVPAFDDLSVELGSNYLDAASDRLARENDILGALIIRVCKVRFLFHKGEVDAAIETLKMAESKWLFGSHDDNLEQARRWLESQIATSIQPSARTRIRKTLKKLSRVSARARRLAGKLPCISLCT
jgi:hypothetical protein